MTRFDLKLIAFFFSIQIYSKSTITIILVLCYHNMLKFMINIIIHNTKINHHNNKMVFSTITTQRRK